MAKSGKSGLQQGEGGMMDPALGPGQDGFNQTSHVTRFKENPCTYPQVGRDEATASDSRGKAGVPPGPSGKA